MLFPCILVFLIRNMHLWNSHSCYIFVVVITIIILYSSNCFVPLCRLWRMSHAENSSLTAPNQIKLEHLRISPCLPMYTSLQMACTKEVSYWGHCQELERQQKTTKEQVFNIAKRSQPIVGATGAKVTDECPAREPVEINTTHPTDGGSYAVRFIQHSNAADADFWCIRSLSFQHWLPWTQT